MSRTRFLAAGCVLGAVLAVALFAVGPANAEPMPAAQATMVATATSTATITSAVPSAVGAHVSSSISASQSVTLGASMPLSSVTAITLTTSVTTASPSAAVTATNSITPGQPITLASPITQVVETLEGTIVANLSATPAKFFVEGDIYKLPPRLSTGLDLPRPTEMMMLYTCSADDAGNPGPCYWDAYLLQKGALYEVRPSGAGEANSGLLLAAAEPPPDGQVWIQNRTGHAESVVYLDQTYDLAPGVVQEFAVSADAPAVLYVRSCVNINDKSVCEWSPKSVDAAAFYAMQQASTAGAEPGSTVTTIDLVRVLSGAEVAATPQATVICTLQVPAVNIRSGPGLQYDIVAKVRSTAQAPATVVVTGHSADQMWYTVEDAVAPGGWVTSSSNFIVCSGDVAGLPEVEFSGAPVAQAARPTPAATAVIAPAADQGSEPEVTPAPEAAGEAPAPVVEDTPTPEPEPSGPAVPPGQALLVVNNGFMYDMRFTIDQLYRPEEGPSEYDLAPGDSVSIVVFPGQVAFTASSPWNGLSGNADIYVEPDQAVPLWLRFEQDAGESSKWNLAWQ